MFRSVGSVEGLSRSDFLFVRSSRSHLWKILGNKFVETLNPFFDRSHTPFISFPFCFPQALKRAAKRCPNPFYGRTVDTRPKGRINKTREKRSALDTDQEIFLVSFLSVDSFFGEQGARRDDLV